MMLINDYSPTCGRNFQDVQKWIVQSNEKEVKRKELQTRIKKLDLALDEYNIS